MESVDVAILGATAGEIAPLSALGPSSRVEVAGNLFSAHIYGDLRLLIGTTGIGKVNAAAIAAAVLSSFRAVEVWNVGCAGAYRGSGLEIGDVLIADNCICADEGILAKEGPMPTSSLEIPLVVKNGQPFYDRFPLSESLSRRQIRDILPEGIYSPDPSGGIRLRSLGDTPSNGLARSPDMDKKSSFRIRYGPSLTVGMTSGDIQTAGARFRRFGALAENMEGSAIAQTCLLFDVPFLEFRGISNTAGMREKAGWDLSSATDHCLAAVRRLLDNR